MKLFLNRFGLYFAWLIAMIGTFSSIYASQIINYQPCIFCWYQRIMMFPLTIILGIAAYKNDKKIVPYVIALPILGAVIAIFQTIFSYVDFSFYCEEGCFERSAKLFGVIDFSIASFFSFVTISVLLLFANKKIRKH